MLSSFLLWICVVIVLGAIVFWGLPKLKWLNGLLLPMWLPLSVLVVAALALFATDQGRDLGVGLLGADQFKLFLLALALFYWATGSWHAARLGLNRQFGADRAQWPPGYEPWLRWLPRLVGACVHLFAALSLAFAARRVPDVEPVLGIVPVWLVGFAAPAFILIAVFILWLLDQRYVAARADPNAPDLVEKARAQTRRAIWVIIIAGLALAVVLWLLGDPAGLAAATGWVLASAAGFLLIVSYRRAIGRWVLARRSISSDMKHRLEQAFDEKDRSHARSSSALALLLTGVALAVAIWTFVDPVSLGWSAGAMVLGFFAFGSYIAVIDLLRIFARTGARFAAMMVFLLLLAALTPATRDFHRVRLCSDGPDACAGTGEAGAGTWVEQRPTVAEAAKAWFAQARQSWRGDGPVPMLIVATAGGGIRAAYWTATVLEQLEEQLGPGVLRRHLFAISGVSGGSVGALAFVAAPDLPGEEHRATRYLKQDFLAPPIAALAFVDGPSTFLPDVGQQDRGYALEHAWERASGDVLAQPFLSFFPTKEALHEEAWRPALLLNATHQSTGRRVITSHLQVERRVFLDAFDAHDLMKTDMPASAAGHNSARFTYVSPAGKLVPPQPQENGPSTFGFVLDGGYFENFGAVTALQLLREVREVLGAEHVRPMILQISSDPSLSSRDRARMDQDASLCNVAPGALEFEEKSDGGDPLSTFFNELTAPIAGIMSSRVAHGTLASEELAHAICTLQWQAPAQTPMIDVASVKQGARITEIGGLEPGASPRLEVRPQYAHFALCEDAGLTEPPLGWVLSPLQHRQFAKFLEACNNDDELRRVLQAFGNEPG